MREIKSLTSLRGIFAMWVMFYHSCRWIPEIGIQRFPFIEHGYLAVDFFFMLSGYILTLTHADDFRSGSIFPYLIFLRKRFFRLFPLHWAILIVILLSLPVMGIAVPWWQYVVGEFLLIHRWEIWPASGTPLNIPDWSISTEWAVNLLFPLFMIVYRAPRATACILAIFFGALEVLVFWRNGGNMNASQANSLLPLLRCIGEFGLGVLLARFPVPSLLRTGSAAQLLSVRPLHWLGEISYSIYLVQIPIILGVRQLARFTGTVRSPIWVVVLATSVIAVSWATYRLIEKPGRSLGRFYSNRPATT